MHWDRERQIWIWTMDCSIHVLLADEVIRCEFVMLSKPSPLVHLFSGYPSNVYTWIICSRKYLYQSCVRTCGERSSVRKPTILAQKMPLVVLLQAWSCQQCDSEPVCILANHVAECAWPEYWPRFAWLLYMEKRFQNKVELNQVVFILSMRMRRLLWPNPDAINMRILSLSAFHSIRWTATRDKTVGMPRCGCNACWERSIHLIWPRRTSVNADLDLVSDFSPPAQHLIDLDVWYKMCLTMSVSPWGFWYPLVVVVGQIWCYWVLYEDCVPEEQMKELGHYSCQSLIK